MKSEREPMFCNDCGKEISNKANFCKYCGSEVQAKSTEPKLAEDEEKKPGDSSEAQPETTKDYQSAGFWIRFGAHVIDYALILLLVILVVILGITWGPESDTLVGISFLILYHTISLSIFSTTPGKVFYGLRVVDAKNKDNLNFGKAFGRSLSYLLSSLIFGLGFIFVAFDKKKQGWHDKIANTLVIKKDKRLFWPVSLSLLSLVFIVVLTGYGYSEDYPSYLPSRSVEIFKSLDDFLARQPSDFQSLLSLASSNDRDFKIDISASEETKTSDEIVAKQGDAVVLVVTDIAFGSGFIIHPEGVIATNYHVVEDAYKVAVSLTNGDKHVVTSVVDYNKGKDIAILKIDGKNLPTVSIGNSDNIKVGEEVIVIGNPEGFDNSVSKGIVSSTDRGFEGVSYIQIDAPISEGSSGGPIFDGKGRVIAIATLFLESGQNLNFGIPINSIFDSEPGNLVRN